MLSISEFGQMCQLPPQTLRFYHSEGLLIPAEVDEQTGYRSYTFDQIERAMLITVLRDTGMSIKLIRRALDEPDTVRDLLHQHVTEVHRQRRKQDEAISDARQFFTSSPEPRRRHVPEMTVVSTVVPGSPSSADQFDWETSDAATAATVAGLVRTVESCGAKVTGTAWRTWAMETPEQRTATLTTMEGPHWLVKVPIAGGDDMPVDLPGDIEVQTFEAREELSIFIPGRSSMAKFGTAMSRLATHQLDGAWVDITRMRQIIHEDGTETSAALCKFDEKDMTSLLGWFTP
ncbi:MerR family transcriptional regulator [Prauserella oleivorans]|uniref:MerR family transcriptional regulator n=1 Tax=Prauserella oleivorans TaxID=1478153 RepID=A0ABW5WC92_9PSEU